MIRGCITCIFVALTILVPTVEAKVNNFDLYQKSRPVDSIYQMNIELKDGKLFSSRELNRMISRLNSTYETHPEKISTDFYLQVLKKINAQKHAGGMDMDGELLLEQVRQVQDGLVSTRQIENLIKLNIGSTEGIRRSLRFLAIKMEAYRMYKRTRNIHALFLAGKAGYYRYATGTQQLEEFIEICERQPSREFCKKHFAEAEIMVKEAHDMRLGD